MKVKVKLVLLPMHTFELDVDTVAVGRSLTITVTSFEFTVGVDKHGVAFDVITTETISPLVKMSAYMAELVPDAAPFLYHW